MSDRNWVTNNQRSILGIEWTNQHGCGGNELGDPHKLNCEIILQYMCNAENYVWDMTRDDCTMECFVPTPQNPNCLTGTPTVPGCPVVEMNATGCAAAGYRFQTAQYYDQYNCPHKCTVNGATTTAASRAVCEASSGTWQVHTGAANGLPAGPWMRFRDGLTTNRQDYTQPNNNQLTPADDIGRKDGDVRYDRGLHESWDWYDDCYRRERNRGN